MEILSLNACDSAGMTNKIGRSLFFSLPSLLFPITYNHKKNLPMSSNSQWSSRVGFILASAGSAIGLGAIWKFPFWAGANGGAAFIIPYIIFTFTIGVVLVMAEVAIGRKGRGSVVTALRSVGGPWYSIMGTLGVLTSFVILSYYSVVGGWCVSYLWDALCGSVTISDPQVLKDHFGNLVADGTRNVAWHLTFLTITCGVVVLGVEAGIERVSKYLMPMLFILMLAIIVRGLTLPGAWAGVEYLFNFKWENLTSDAILNAMGFTFFSLSLGGGILVTYGSYLSSKTSVPHSSLWIAVLAIQAAILAGLMIMPAVFAFGMEPNGGPGLVFITVPMIFSHIPFGEVFAFFFYVCLLVAALTSAVSLLEVVTAYMQNEWNLSRRKAVFVNWTTLFLLGSVSALSFGVWSGFTVGGRNFFDLLDYVCTNFMMPFGGLVIATLAGWKAWPTVREQFMIGNRYGEGYMKVFHFILAVLAPMLVLVAFYQGLFG